MSCGTRARDFRPGDPDGARLLRSSLGDQLLVLLYCVLPAACDSAALRQPAPLCICSGTPLPNFPVRASAADAFTEVLHTASLPVLRTALADTAVLLTAAPDHCGPPGPVVSPVAVLQPLWLRNSTTAPSCALQLRIPPPGSSCLPGPVPLWATRENITTTPPNVYSRERRFPHVHREDNRPRTGHRADLAGGPLGREPAARRHRLHQEQPRRKRRCPAWLLVAEPVLTLFVLVWWLPDRPLRRRTLPASPPPPKAPYRPGPRRGRPAVPDARPRRRLRRQRCRVRRHRRPVQGQRPAPDQSKGAGSDRTARIRPAEPRPRREAERSQQIGAALGVLSSLRGGEDRTHLTP